MVSASIASGRLLRRAAGDPQRLDEAHRDLVGVAAGDLAEARAAVEAFDRDRIGHAVAHEGVAHVVLEEEAPDAGEVGFEAAGDRPSDDARRFGELVGERRAGDVDVDRLGIADAELSHLLRARQHHGVVAARPGIEERRSLEARQVAAGGRVRGALGMVAQIGRRIERQQHRHRACRDIGESLAGRAVEVGDPFCRRGGRLERLDRAQFRADRVPVDLGMGNARAFHILRRRRHDAGGEREARDTESPHVTLHTLPERSLRRPGRGQSIVVPASPAK